jgi:hypothetical protein
MSKKQKKRPGYSKRSAADKIIRSLAGYWMRWSLVDPLGEHDQPVNAQVGSTNPYISLRLRNDLFWDAARQVLHHRRLKWRIEVSMEFERKDGSSEFKPMEMVAYGALPDLDEHYQGMVETLFQDAKNKNYLSRYVKTHVVQEVLDGQEIRDTDWTEQREAQA